MAGRGALIGFLLYLALAGTAYLTPARVPVLMFAGRDYTVLRLEHAAQQQVVRALNSRTSRGPELERARADVAATESRMQAWKTLNAKTSALGLLGWLLELWPWLLGLGLTLPFLGGMIGAQVRKPGRAASKAGRQVPAIRDDEAVSTPSMPPTSPVTSEPARASSAAFESTPPPPSSHSASVTPGTSVAPSANVLRELESEAPATPRTPPSAPPPSYSSTPPSSPFPSSSPSASFPSTPSPVDTPADIRPPDPAAWNWSVRPAARPATTRPKPPPVKSPHGEKREE